MRSISTLLCLGGLFIAQTAFAQAPEVSRKVAKAMKKVEPAAIKEHISYLADDKLKGRMPGTEGYQMAVDYVIAKYKKAGVQPGGENGSYLQTVRIRKAYTGNDASLVATSKNGPMALEHGKDFAIYPSAEEQQVSVEAPLVFAGYGITAPDLNYDDYASIDAKGKIVVILRGTPASFPGTVAAYSMDMHTILKNAASHGAVGVIVGTTNPKAGVPNLQKGVNSIMGADGKVAVSRNFVTDQIRLLANVNAETTLAFFKTAGLDAEKTAASLKAGVPASATLPVSVKASYTSSYKNIESYNVVGKIEGSDAKLKDEYVVHSAHLDHVGIGTPVNGDSIYNGAHDNASGVASILEIANIYSKVKAKPKRSVLLVMVTAEEMGLLGSAYFAKYPTVPKEKIVADINTDMPTIIAPLLAVVPLGANHSSLEQVVAGASRYFNLDVESDPEPEQNRFIRSDQYSFVVQGIPALHIKYGNKTADGKNNLSEYVQKWREVHYHKPQDELNDTFDFEAGKKYVQLNFLIGYQIAQNPERPTWKQGDFFGSRFGQPATMQQSSAK
ncbi:M28 family peptidase [Pontibacter vulgaris]|uniref:M28 family peptidase n=1 Tax=Pontibacter vulgaris TaxID=2905679 RepID=UPI001FA76B08|nr:M28 family peptidase [Pontibacter vulgaris]